MSKRGCVYFVLCPGMAMIKIGWTSKLKKRLLAIRTSNPDKVELLLTLEGNRTLERKMHQRFKQFRRSGEWFEAAPELLTAIQALKDGAAVAA